MLRLLTIAFLVAMSAAAHAASPPALEFEGRLTTGPSYDTNVRRSSSGAGVVSDSGLFLLASGDLRWRPAEGHLTTLSLDGGGRLFATVGGENQLAHVFAAGHHLRLVPELVAGVEARRRDRAIQSGRRDSADTSANLAMEWRPTSFVAPRLKFGWRRFDWWPDERWSAQGPWAAAAVQLRPWRRHTATAGYDLHLRDFPGRREILHQGHLQWTWRSRVMLSGGYLFGVSDSDVEGYASVRHRLQLLVGAPLPAGFVLTGQGVLQLVSFPEGFRLDPVTVADDEENLSSLSLKLSRELGANLSIDARYQLHLATFVRARLQYERHLFGTGLTWRF